MDPVLPEEGLLRVDPERTSHTTTLAVHGASGPVRPSRSPQRGGKMSTRVDDVGVWEDGSGRAGD